MKVTYGENKMPAKICEVNNFEYLEKLIYTEVMFKICNTIFKPPSSLHPALSNHPKINTTNILLKVSFNYP